MEGAGIDPSGALYSQVSSAFLPYGTSMETLSLPHSMFAPSKSVSPRASHAASKVYPFTTTSGGERSSMFSAIPTSKN